MLTRRALVSSACALALLTGCNLVNQSADQIKTDIETIAAGLAGLATAASAFVPPNILAQVQTVVNQIEADAANIANSITGISTNSLITDIANAVGVLGTLLAPFFPQAPVIAGIVQAAAALINFVVQTLGIGTPTPAMARFMKAAPSTAITPDAARLILRNAAATGIR